MTVLSHQQDDKPALVTTIAILTLINGIINIFWGLVALDAVLKTVFLACLSGFAILPTVLGVFEIIYAAKLLAEPMQPVQPSRPIAIFEILCLLAGNIFSMIVGILSLVFYNDPQVMEYFNRLNSNVPPEPTPTSLPKPQEAPKAPKAPAAPKPKVTPGRKVAAKESSGSKEVQKPRRTTKKGSSSS